MNGKNTRRGFTLIELLVVVVIIAILAAIALPQYNKAVKKSRLAELQTYMATLRKAAAVAMMEPEKTEEQESGAPWSSYAPANLDATFSYDFCSFAACVGRCSFGSCSFLVDGDVDNPVIGVGLWEGQSMSALFRLDNSGFACNGSACADFGMTSQSFSFSQPL